LCPTIPITIGRATSEVSKELQYNKGVAKIGNEKLSKKFDENYLPGQNVKPLVMQGLRCFS